MLIKKIKKTKLFTRLRIYRKYRNDYFVADYISHRAVYHGTYEECALARESQFGGLWILHYDQLTKQMKGRLN